MNYNGSNVALRYQEIPKLEDAMSGKIISSVAIGTNDTYDTIKQKIATDSSGMENTVPGWKTENTEYIKNEFHQRIINLKLVKDKDRKNLLAGPNVGNLTAHFLSGFYRVSEQKIADTMSNEVAYLRNKLGADNVKFIKRATHQDAANALKDDNALIVVIMGHGYRTGIDMADLGKPISLPDDPHRKLRARQSISWDNVRFTSKAKLRVLAILGCEQRLYQSNWEAAVGNIPHKVEVITLAVYSSDSPDRTVAGKVPLEEIRKVGEEYALDTPWWVTEGEQVREIVQYSLKNFVHIAEQMHVEDIPK